MMASPPCRASPCLVEKSRPASLADLIAHRAVESHDPALGCFAALGRPCSIRWFNANLRGLIEAWAYVRRADVRDDGERALRPAAVARSRSVAVRSERARK